MNAQPALFTPPEAPPAEVTFFVAGVPATKGSTKSFMNPKTQRIITIGDNPRTKQWQAAVGLAAEIAGVRPAGPGEPIAIAMNFRMQRPKYHLTKAGGLGSQATQYPTQIPDLDKLERAICDGLKGVAYRDDSQIVRVVKLKAWCDPDETPGCDITIFRL
jgi:Holliday junction resolvase RusA-like endonuclease